MKELTAELLEPHELRVFLQEATPAELFVRAEKLRKIIDQLRDQEGLLRVHSDQKARRIALGDWVKAERWPRNVWVVIGKDLHPRTGKPRIWGRTCPNKSQARWNLGLRRTCIWTLGDPYLTVVRRWPETAEDLLRANWGAVVEPPKW